MPDPAAATPPPPPALSKRQIFVRRLCSFVLLWTLLLTALFSSNRLLADCLFLLIVVLLAALGLAEFYGLAAKRQLYCFERWGLLGGVLLMVGTFLNLTGNGCHAHVSVWDKNGKNNLFHDPKGELGLSALAYEFLGGVIHNAEALCSFFNPTVNSYKRINAPRTLSGASWSPNTVTYTGNNRTHMIRIPDAGRFEFRLGDGAANPYAMQAAVLIAGLDGIENKRDPGERLDIDMYAEGHKVTNAKKLPLNLLDALRALEASPILRKGLGEPFISAYIKLKQADWNEYASQLTDWERRTTLDC